MSRNDRYAVVGYPVAHSKSPMIHGLFAEQTGQQINYERMEIAPEDFICSVREFFAQGGKGLNITLPHKETAWQLVQWRAPNADRAGAVNTVYQLDDGRLAGDNTDGVGLVRDIEQNHGGKLRGARILVLGAGGAVRGVLPRLIAAQPSALCIVNRTVSRAEALTQVFADQFNINVLSYEQLQEQATTFDWIINGSAGGLKGELPPLPATLVAAGTACYDMVYAPGGTVFQQWAKANGAAMALDGTGMLVEQAAESFRLWRGVRPQTAPVIAALRKALS
ncbi:shikimate dehydrogenase [Pseudohongiella sp.]|uniref:shikimate dehydrogenase (NADP(+)) n=1 Tax=marine sediment metagenome TaxID=412755 RepID=A0A0F9VUT7_9ZZZZ|nr:shikimate dehydrogenase [Pseudohongiella sp.]HDZ08680.1 shikimate dehydrogenase [Pseudohongiella sp.]HEA62296.1 shikimate dehydrogenase [Pseudohongiella sp.]